MYQRVPAVWWPVAWAAACAAGWAHAETSVNAATVADKTLSSVVVTASGTAVDIREAPASVSVITREDIERQPVSSIGALLGTLPGVSGGQAATGAQSKIRLRGLPEKYTLILIDGQRQGNSSGVNYRDDLGQQDLDWISPDMIERIEVVRGPMSSLYGSDAMGGVINIITRKIGTRWAGSGTVNYSSPADGQRGDTQQVGFQLSGPLSDTVGVRLGGNYTERDSDERTAGVGSSALATPGARNQNLDATLHWKLTPEQWVSLSAGQGVQQATASDARLPNGNPVVSAWGLSRLEHNHLSLAHEGRWGDVKTRVNLAHHQYEDKGDTVGNNSQETTLDARLDRSVRWGGLDQALTVGMQWKREQLDNRDTIGVAPIDYAGNRPAGSSLQASTWALFVEDQVFLRENLALTLGLRTDHHEKYGSNWSPRAYLVYHPQETWTLRGGVSRGFRAPGLKENSASAATRSGGNGCRSLAGLGWTSASVNANGTRGCYMAGNPNLQPETSTNMEVGASWERGGLSAGATYFHTDFKNKIDYQPLGFFNGYWWTRMDNAQSARTRGLELTGKAALGAGWEWSGNLTRMFESKNLSTGAQLLAVPQVTAYTQLQWRVRPGLVTTLAARHTGKELLTTGTASTFAKAYTTIDLSVGWEVTSTATVRAGVVNLTDKQTRDLGSNYDNGGRTYFVGLTARF